KEPAWVPSSLRLQSPAAPPGLSAATCWPIGRKAFMSVQGTKDHSGRCPWDRHPAGRGSVVGTSSACAGNKPSCTPHKHVPTGCISSRSRATHLSLPHGPRDTARISDHALLDHFPFA